MFDGSCNTIIYTHSFNFCDLSLVGVRILVVINFCEWKFS